MPILSLDRLWRQARIARPSRPRGLPDRAFIWNRQQIVRATRDRHRRSLSSLRCTIETLAGRLRMPQVDPKEEKNRAREASVAENSGKVAIIIALITTAGVLGAKYIEVWPTRAPPNEGNGSTGTPPVPAVPTIEGSWQDQFGSRFEIATDAGALTLTGNNADKEMAGKGTVSGRTMTVAITNTLEPGTIRCAGEIASATSIRSSCTGPDSAQFEWLLTR